MSDNTSFDNEIKETQDKKVILNQNKTQLFCGQIDEQRSANRSGGFYGEVMRICKLIDAENGYEWLSLSYIINEIENIFPCVYTVLEILLYSFRNTCWSLE